LKLNDVNIKYKEVDIQESIQELLSNPIRIWKSTDNKRFKILSSGFINPLEGPDLKNISIYYEGQILTGDAADNIKGLLRVGPVKADKLLEGLTEEKELYEAVVKAYDGDKGRVLENARLLWLRREEGQMWQPPE
jgi:5'-3' exonuclease